jgi:hypothetical protein
MRSNTEFAAIDLEPQLRDEPHCLGKALVSAPGGENYLAGRVFGYTHENCHQLR